MPQRPEEPPSRPSGVSHQSCSVPCRYGGPGAPPASRGALGMAPKPPEAGKMFRNHFIWLRPAEAALGYHNDVWFDRRGARAPGSGTRAAGRPCRRGPPPGAVSADGQLIKIHQLVVASFFERPQLFFIVFLRAFPSPDFRLDSLLGAETPPARQKTPPTSRPTRARASPWWRTR